MTDKSIFEEWYIANFEIWWKAWWGANNNDLEDNRDETICKYAAKAAWKQAQ